MSTEYDVMELFHDVAWREAEFARLRREEPLVFDEDHNWWLVLRHADVRAVGSRDDVFSSSLKGAWHLFDATHVNIQTLDGPEHTRYRNSVSRAFTPRMAARLSETALRAVDEAIDSILDRGLREFDFVSELAVPVPLRVIGDMVGIEPGDYDRFRRWSDDAFASAEVNLDPAELERAQASSAELMSYLREAVAKRRAQPQDDVLSAIIRADEQGTYTQTFSLDDDQALDFATTLMLAGNETTRHAISGSFYVLDQHPTQRERLRADPSLWKTAADELLRWTSPVRTLRRTAAQDTTLGGQRIQEGESLLMMYQSANRDEQVFDAPHELRIDRPDAKEQIAFGMGPHYCLGANLAKMELRTAIERIAERLPGLRVAEGAAPEPNRSSIIDGVDRLPVVLEDAAAAH